MIAPAVRASQDFYPRPPRGGRPAPGARNRPGCDISIHALREEGDLIQTVQTAIDPISIHALREEGDLQRSGHDARHSDFYPRPPRVGPPKIYDCYNHMFDFNSTPSAWWATRGALDAATRATDFYPRPPRGGRLELDSGDGFATLFLSTPSARRATPEKNQ